MNNYIYAYYQKIKNGDVVVGKWIIKLYENIIKGLENKDFYFSQKKADKAIYFIETYCKHHEGQKALQAFKLELWQKALISLIFGIVDEEGVRQFREVFVVMGRKNGKTLLASAIASYCAFFDGEYGAKIYFTAPKLEQASLCFDAFVQNIYKNEALNALAKKRRTDIYIESTNTTAKPIAFSVKKSDGYNCSFCCADELASWQGDGGLKFYEVIKSSQGARLEPLILSITTSGYINDGIYDELVKRSTRYLMGDSKEKRLLPVLYMIDDIRKWNDINELRKSNPNLNVSVSIDYLLNEIAIAETSLAHKSEFICKYCNIKQNSSQAWLNAKDIEVLSGSPINLEDFKGCYAVGGIDLSMSTDLTACTCVIEKNGILHVLAKFFLPTEKIEEATARDGLPYQIYIQRGLLVPSGDNFIDYNDCFNWFTELVDKYKILPLKVGYDRYSSNYLINDMRAYGFNCDDVYQGYNLTPVIREFEGLVKNHVINIGDNDLLKIHLLNGALKVDNESERCKLVKINKNDHIDGLAALLDAFTVRQKYYGEIGGQLQNIKRK